MGDFRMRMFRTDTMANPIQPGIMATHRAVRREIADIVAVDARSLSLVRIMLALCLLVDLTHAANNFTALFSDSGVLPRLALHGMWRPGVENSLYLMSGLQVVNDALLAMQYIALLALLVGYRTRLAIMTCLVFTISLQARNFITNQGSDDLMRLLLFGALFVPMGARWSVDAALSPKRIGNRINSVGAVAIQIQAMCVYTFGALIKAEGTAWPAGHAVAMALSDGTYGSAFGRLFLALPGLLHVATYLVSSLELVMPLLIWFPIANHKVRTASLLALIGMHLSFLVFLHVGMFPYVSITSLMLFVTSRHWDMLERLWRPAVRCTDLFYDRDCGFCYKTCLLLRGFCLPATVRIANAQADQVAGPLLARHQSWVVRDSSGHDHLRWDAVCFVFLQSPVFWVLGWLGQRAVLRSAGDWLYGLIGRQRNRLGRVSERFLSYRSDDGHRGVISEILAAGFLCAMLVYNIGQLQATAAVAPQWFRNFVIDTRLEQRWAMFAPNPRSVTEWAVARAVTVDGQVLNVFGGIRRPYSDASPPDGQVEYRDTKWKKYYEALFQPLYTPLRPYYVNWLCRRVNRGVPSDARVQRITLLLFIEQPFLAHPPPRKQQVLWHQACF